MTAPSRILGTAATSSASASPNHQHLSSNHHPTSFQAVEIDAGLQPGGLEWCVVPSRLEHGMVDWGRYATALHVVNGECGDRGHRKGEPDGRRGARWVREV